MLQTAADNYQEELTYYCSLDDVYLEGMQNDVGRLGALYQEVLKSLYDHKQVETANTYTLQAYSILNERFSFNSSLAASAPGKGGKGFRKKLLYFCCATKDGTRSASAAYTGKIRRRICHFRGRFKNAGSGGLFFIKAAW